MVLTDLICVRGKQHEISTGTTDLKLAKRFHRQKLDELAADRKGLKTGISHLVLSWTISCRTTGCVGVKSLGSALSHIKPLRDHFGDCGSVDINYRAIEAYITKRRENDNSNATINRELELLRRALRLAHDRQLLPSIPKVRVLTENNTRQSFFERPDLEAVVAALPDDLRDFTRFAYLTGWRKGEIISLKWTDVDRDAGAIRLRPEAAKTEAVRSCSRETWPSGKPQPRETNPARRLRLLRPVVRCFQSRIDHFRSEVDVTVQADRDAELANFTPRCGV